MRPTRHNATCASRGGFSLVELLVVIAIIALVSAMVIAVYADSLTAARIEATRATITQLDAALQDRLEAFQRLNLRSQAQRFELAYNANRPPMTPPVSSEVAEIVVRKDRFRAAFPQRLEDLWGFDGVPGGGDDAPLWQHWKQKVNQDGGFAAFSSVTDSDPRPTGHRVDLENSELLYLALTEGAVFGAPSLTLDNIKDNHILDTPVDRDGDGSPEDIDGDGIPDGNGIPELYDDWGNLLRFYNWPTRLIRPDGTGSDINRSFFALTARTALPQLPEAKSQNNPSAPTLSWDEFSHPLNQDPDDQTGALSAAINFGFFNSPFDLGGPNLAVPLDERFYHTFDTYHVPLIVSAGPDGDTGLFEPTAADPRDPSATVTISDFPRRLAQPLAWPSPTSDLIDQIQDNVTNRRR